MQAMPNVADDELVLVLYGDVPLIRAETLRQLIAPRGREGDEPAHRHARRSDRLRPHRAQRAGAIQKIVEQKDASKAQLKIREGNSGIMAVPARLLRKWLGKLRNANAQGEYYLTDVIAMAVRDKVKVTPLIAPTVAEVLGVNDKVAARRARSAASRGARARADGGGRDAGRPGAHRHPRRRSRSGATCSSTPTCCSKAGSTLGDRVRVGPERRAARREHRRGFA